MHKRTDIQELDIPKDDIECWNRYPKFRWVYDLSRLLDSQHIKWSPFSVDDLPNRELNIELDTDQQLIRQPGFVYVKHPEGKTLITEVFAIKGEIKEIRHIDPDSGKPLTALVGEVELRISAFMTLHFQKFTGVISFHTHSNEIYRVKLRPHVAHKETTNIELTKLIKRIYKKSDTTINGPSDQVLQETLAS